MRPGHEACPALRVTLRRHFPDASQERINHFANEINTGASAAASLEWIERNDRRSEDDIGDLRKASNNLRNAATKIRALGWHGGMAAQEFAQKVHQMQFRHEGNAVLGVQGSIEIIAEFFDGLAEEIRRSADGIHPTAASVMSAFGDDRSAGRPRGRPNETEAYFVAREAYSAFQELAGRKPTVVTDRITNVAGGPYLEFLTDVFSDQLIDASAETWARQVCREKNLANR